MMIFPDIEKIHLDFLIYVFGVRRNTTESCYILKQVVCHCTSNVLYVLGQSPWIMAMAVGTIGECLKLVLFLLGDVKLIQLTPKINIMAWVPRKINK